MKRYWILTAILAVSACSQPVERITAAEPQAVVAPLFGTLYSNIRESRRLVIRDAATWSQLWAEMASDGSVPATPPVIDFEKENVVVAAMGERKAAGYAISIQDVAESSAGSLHVDVASTIPNPACAASDVITTPLAAVRIPRTDLPVQFSEKTVVMTCS